MMNTIQAQTNQFGDSVYINQAKTLLLTLNIADFQKATTFFDESVANQVSPAVLKKAWEQLEGQVGDIKSTGRPRIEGGGSQKVVYIPCVFENITLDFKVPFSDKQKALGFFFVPHADPGDYKLPSYADTSVVTEQKITVVSGDIKLPGVFLYPKNPKKKIPIVILVHGSGPNDMDESIEANKPFKDLAYGLAKQGIGVIRYDKRTKIYARQMLGKNDITLESETIIDAISAARLARSLPQADTNRIIIIGHSLGAMAAPLIAAQAGYLVNGIVIIAGPARPLEDIIYEQYDYLGSLVPNSRNKKDLSLLKIKVNNVHKGNITPQTPSSALPLDLPAPYWIFLHNYHQTDEVKKLTIPILILQGERDYQVSMDDFKLWEKALKNKKNVSFKSYPKLNHLFMEGEGKSVPAEYDTPGHVADYVVDDIAKWTLGIGK